MSLSSSVNDPPSIESNHTQMMDFSVPSSSILRKYKMELHLDQPLDSESYASNHIKHFYRPGDQINGEVLVIPPVDLDEKDTIKYNEVSISLHCKVITDMSDNSKKEIFTMNDDPLDMPEDFSKEVKFPFSFTLPEELFDNICPHNIELHKQLPPSFASPRLCGMAFSGTSVAGSTPSVCPQAEFYKDLPLNKFCVVYFITATLKQKSHQNGDARIIMKRILDVSVKSNFEPIPTNIRKSLLDISNHYSITDFTNSQDLIDVRRTSLKHDSIPIGTLTSFGQLPPALKIFTNEEYEKVGVSLKYESNSNTGIPKLRYEADIIQYVVQSTCCLPPNANPAETYNTLKVELVGHTRKSTLEVRRINCKISEDEWRPGYGDNGELVKDLQVQIPYLGQHKLEPTFHSCKLQNMYVLKIEVIHETLEKKSKVKSTSKFSFLDKVSRTIKSSNNITSHKLIEKNGGLTLRIPITLLG